MSREVPKQDTLAEALDKVAYTLDKAYINRLTTDYYACPIDTNKISYSDNIRFLKVKRWIKDADESIIDCFKNALGVFSSITDNNIAMIIQRTSRKTDMYFAVRTVGQNMNSVSKENIELLESALSGNYPGSEFEIIPGKDGSNIEKILFDENMISSVSTVCGVPSQKSDKFLTQGIEKLLDGMVPTEDDKDSYTLVILAEPLTTDESRKIINGYEDLASILVPYTASQFQHLSNSSETKGEMKSKSITKSVSNAISNTFSVNAGIGLSIGVDKIASINPSVGFGYSHGKTTTEGEADSESDGVNYAVSEGIMEGETYTFKSYPVTNLLEKAEKTIKRLNASQSNGTWRYAVYVLSPSSNTTKSVAGFFSAVMQGDDSYIELPHVNTWLKDGKGTYDSGFNNIFSSVSLFSHPVFANKLDGTKVTATSFISTSELSALFAFPRYSVQGLPIVECARFGREPHGFFELKSDIRLGCVYHMHKASEKSSVFLDKSQLTSHTFITGATGSGKSNTLYQILSQANEQGVKFLVIEPAKGEYKNVFSMNDNVSVYGTNPGISPILRINPFSFPKGIHVLEHLDRLVELFNVCWPMYAAMPAVLKNAVEKSYEDCGWDLTESTNCYGEDLYPKFADVALNVKRIIDSSEYDSENKGAYKGSLLTRLTSLTNGINGLVFTDDEINETELFDKNVIVDLSRVGSSETKSLLMGMLVLKLQEYRMTQGDMNATLKHITVLEEAHNLLKRTSSGQVSESADLQGKSVEMLSNAIAEMRTYGEGFIIADQAPGLLDMATIRNTNTKIIMRLPDISDRELVGRAANLNENQITELAKLPRGDAAVYQSEWIEPVLCKVDKYDCLDSQYQFIHEKNEKSNHSSDEMLSVAQLLSSGTHVEREIILKDIIPRLHKNRIPASIQVSIAKMLENPPKKPRMTKLAPVMCSLFPELHSAIKDIYSETHSELEWTAYIESRLHDIIQQDIDDQTRRDIIQGVVTNYLLNEINDVTALKKWSEIGGLK